MGKSLQAAALAAAAALGAAAAAAAALAPPAPVTALAAAQGRIAYATAWTRTRCERVAVGTHVYGPRVCPEVSTGRGIAAVELAGTRALWLAYAGGNSREWQLETATPSSPRPRQLRFVAQDVDLPPPIVLGPGDGSLLAYAVGRSVIALRADGSRAFAWTAPAAVRALAVAGGRVAAGDATGTITVLAAGRVLWRVATGGPPDAVAFSGDEVVVQVGRQLSRRGPTLGPEYTVQLPKGAHLEDADARDAVYVAGGRARIVLLAGGADTAAGPAQHAAIDAGLLVLANGRSVVSRRL